MCKYNKREAIKINIWEINQADSPEGWLLKWLTCENIGHKYVISAYSLNAVELCRLVLNSLCSTDYPAEFSETVSLW